MSRRSKPAVTPVSAPPAGEIPASFEAMVALFRDEPLRFEPGSLPVDGPAPKLIRDHNLSEPIGIVTALNPYIGYDNSTRLAREALLGGRSVLELVREERLLDDAMLAEILRPENMIAPRLAPLVV